MPKIPVDECPAGPAMDAAVAEALGYECACNECLFICPIHSSDPDVKLHYSTDIAAAWEVIEYLRGETISNLGIKIGWDDHFSIRVAGYWKRYDDWWYDAEAETFPLAICRAFLKANGVEFVEVPE